METLATIGATYTMTCKATGTVADYDQTDLRVRYLPIYHSFTGLTLSSDSDTGTSKNTFPFT